MTEFFDKPVDPDYWVRTARELYGRDELAQREVMEEAAKLQRPVEELKNLFIEKRIEPNTWVNATDTHLLGKGWLIAETSVRSGKANSASIILLKDGRLVIGGPVTGEGTDRRAEAYRNPSPGLVNVPAKTILRRDKTIHGVKKTKWVEAPQGELNPVIDLTKYPPHPLFATERGLANTTLDIPELVTREGSHIDRNSQAGYVAANLEYLENELRRTGWQLLHPNQEDKAS